jgi:predicted DNA-binding transcriptional regulator AlpA
MIDFAGDFSVTISVEADHLDADALRRQLLVARLVVARLQAEVDNLAAALAQRGRPSDAAPAPSTMLNVHQAAERLGVSPSWLYRQARIGLPFARKVGRAVKFDSAALQRWADHRRR